MQILFNNANGSVNFTKILFFHLIILNFSLSFRIPNTFKRDSSFLTHHSLNPRLNDKFSVNLFSDPGVSSGNKYLITTPLFYLNGPPHLGHAYTLVSSDVLKRFLILSGHDCKLLAGTDEHGSKIKTTAANFGYSPKEYVISMRNQFFKLYKAYDITPEIVVHTSENEHKSKVKRVFDNFLESGHIYRGLHRGYFSPKEDLYYTESKLINGKSPLGFDVTLVDEPAYFFKLDIWKRKLVEFFKDSEVILPQHSLNEVRKLLQSEINDIAITRSNCDWGIPITNSGNETVYVWFDALLGYLTHLHSFPPLEQSNSNLNGLKIIHVIGKDILTFHTILWPAILMALKLDIKLRFLVHGWLLNKGEKISKSLNNSISPLNTSVPSDVSRFALMNLGDFSYDFEFDPSMFDNALKTLRNKFANTFYRVTSILQMNKVDTVQPCDCDHKLLEKFNKYSEEIRNSVQSFRLDRYIQILVEMSSEVNKFIELTQFWTMSSQSELLNTSWICCTLLLYISIYLAPITPKLANDMILRLGPQLSGAPVKTISFNLLDDIQHISYNPKHLNPLI
ncbi:tRNA synthetases class I (M) family protein [Theileria parva strain Muguga]|uniref:methionine--tRNA ligase n=1 Tax=Theileria parva TaxID=5875 RepID=Q4N6F8_THEPA|nr:tRNA synthetases class I (M) family protein [Theileria parva strain Muguga]EAN34450.1 tRNA synthetases class I (M) family protein [Theileria parva strain Muguga]|eukprot:XP_766733.1 methionyl-tRNA synthetase [Theileria parva strain Muguga]